MFLENKYTSCYNKIIMRSKDRRLEGYKETHHVIPKSLGGTNDKDNLAVLTAREHLICHLLLTKMTTGVSRNKMLSAVHAMTVFRYGRDTIKATSRIYAILREQWANMLSETRKGENNHFYNQKHTDETRKKISDAASKPRSELWKKVASMNRKGENNSFYGKKHSAEQKEKWKTDTRRAHSGIENGFYGKQHSEEQRQKKRIEKLSATKKECCYCGKLVDPMNFNRWHGDKCKMKGTI